MTQEEVIQWMKEHLDGTKAEQTALGMILNDIDEHGFENWLDLPAIPIVEWYMEATNEVAAQLVEDFKSMLSFEDGLDELGIEQSLRLDPVSAMGGFKDGVMDIMKSLLIYLITQEMANAYYGEHTH